MTFYEENEEEPKVYEILLPFVNKGDKMASLYAFHMFKDTSFAEDVDTKKRQILLKNARKNLEQHKKILS